MGRKSLLSLMFICTFVFVSMTWGASFNVLILNAATDGANNEAGFLETATSVGGNSFAYTSVGINFPGNTHPVEGSVELGAEIAAGNINLSDYQIVWMTWNGPGHDEDYFLESAEGALLDYVINGGVIVMTAFDDNFADANGNQIGGWMPIDDHPASISNTGDSEITVTAEGEATGIFDGVDLSGLVLDDNFNTTDPGYVILATRDDNGEVAAFQLDYGDGSYLGVCIDARTTFPAAEQLILNMLAYLAGEVATSVEPTGKMPATWGDMKSMY
jgi:hypothetical protein